MKFNKFVADAEEKYYEFFSYKIRTSEENELTLALPPVDYFELFKDIFELGVISANSNFDERVAHNDILIKQFRMPTGALVNIVESEPGGGVVWSVGKPKESQKNFKSLPFIKPTGEFDIIPGYQDATPAIAMQTLPNRA